MFIERRHGVRYVIVLIIIILVLLMAVQMVSAGETQTVSADTIRKIIVSHIKKQSPWSEGAVRIEFSSNVSDVVLPGREQVTWRVESNWNEDFIGYSMFALRFYRDKVFLKEKRVRVKLEVLRDVVVSAGFLPRNKVIEDGDVKVVKKWMDRIVPAMINDPATAVGNTLSVRVKPNREIKRTMLRSPLMVKKGKLVRIFLEKGPLKISTVGLSQQDGMSGDLIRVKNLTSKKIIYAKVITESTVRVEY